jgi:hypothetical protein
VVNPSNHSLTLAARLAVYDFSMGAG